MSNDSTVKTLVVASALCVVCSILVSTAAVKLRPIQSENKKLDVRKNLLLAAGLLEGSGITKDQIESAFKNVETKMVDLSSGEITDKVDPTKYDLEKADSSEEAKDIDPNADIANIKTRAKVRPVYLVKEGSKVKQIILPFHGKGLWSTMYGFLSLAPDTRTVKGIGFYQHGETPGLGGEIENKKWQEKWVGKKVLSESNNPIFTVIKGSVDSTTENPERKVDGLSGATLTSNGVQAAVNYWVSNNGYGKFLANFRQGGI